MSLRITVVDTETGVEQTATIEPGNYMVICADPCYLDGTQNYSNGTTTVHIRGRSAHLMGTTEVGHG